jgi:hypothetical protein
MILYQLQCEKEHRFEAWFRDSEAFDKQSKRKLLACPECGSAKITKALMAPRIGKSRDGNQPKPAKHTPIESSYKLTPEAIELKRKLKEIQSHISKECDYVGSNFAEEARKIHYGEVTPHGIYGEATSEDAKELVDEGIEFASIPWVPKENA